MYEGTRMRGLAVTLLLFITRSPEVYCQLQMCENVCTSGNGWNSEVNLQDIQACSVLVSWVQDTPTTLYVVQLREQRSGSIFNTSAPVSELTLPFSGLSPLTDYEVQVCQANGSTNDPDNCGNCLKCFTTVFANERPSTPSNLQVIASGPRVVTVDWEVPLIVNGGIRNYTIVCTLTSTGNVVYNNTGVTRTIVNVFNLMPSTNYTCSVVAINAFGNSVPAVGSVATPAESSIPGLLLVVYADQITSTPLVFDNIHLQPTSLFETSDNLITISDVAGIDYHFQRSELFLTTSSGQIIKYNVTFTFDMEDTPELVASQTPSVLFEQTGFTLGSIAVDWVNNDLYWIEYTGGDGSRIMRTPLDETGSLYCVVSWSTSPVLHLAVDPVHGYLYWNRRSTTVAEATGLYRASLTNTRTTTTACPTNTFETTLIVDDDNLDGFTLEPDMAIYHTGLCQDPWATVGLFSRSLNLEMAVCLGSTITADATQTLDSFSDIVFIPVPGCTPEQLDVGGPGCFVDIFNVSATPFSDLARLSSSTRVGMPLIYRVYRSLKQPLPVPPSPPTTIRVQTTSTSATISWQTPLFVGNFFSDGAFSSWNYLIRYSRVSSSEIDTVTNSTTATSITLASLQPDTSYQFTISAEGPRGEREDSNKFVFSTRTEGGDAARLLIATDAGVIKADQDGSGMEYVDIINSKESTGVAYDARLDRIYWTVSGGQGDLFSYTPGVDSVTIHEQRDHPRHLELDWVARRLFWVEDGSTLSGPLSIISFADPFTEAPSFFADDLITATSVDSLNGILFWVAGDTIVMKTLNGLTGQTCLTADMTPAGIAVDPTRRRLYWVSKLSDNCVVSTDTPFCVSVGEADYTRAGCGSPTVQNVLDITLGSSSSAVVAYSSGILYFAPLFSDSLYTVSASLSTVGPDLTPFVGVISFSALDPLPQEFRDIAVMAIEAQPLPGDVESPGLAQVTPVSPGAPSLGESGSASDITIEWEDSNSFSDISYWLDYTLQRIDGSMDMDQIITEDGTSVTLTNQSPFSNVTAVVTAYTLWAGSEPSETGNFFSNPAVPEQVQNVRVLVYFPIRGDGSVVTALVVWDGLSPVEAGGTVDNYTVRVFNTSSGQDVTLSQNGDARTQYSIESREDGFSAMTTANRLFYPLEVGATYGVEVLASNAAGDGPPSATITFTTDVANPPQQVFGVSASGGGVMGDEAPPTLEVTPPLAVNTINRTVYWYSRNQAVLMQQSLNGGEPELLGEPPPGITALAVAYDWVGETVYFIARRGEPGGTLTLGRVAVINPAGLELVFEDEGASLSAVAEVRLAVDPFRGFIYWTLQDGSATSVHQLDLRDPTSSETIPTTERSRRRKRQSLATLTLTSALTLDPATGRLWVCDAATGDILLCDPVTGTCVVEVTANSLMGGEMLADSGLPATSIALDESRIYWTGAGTPGIFYVSYTSTTNLMMLSGTDVSTVLTLSPGQQPLPRIDCLAPDLIDFANRPQATLVNATNITLTINWTAPALPASCGDEVFSFAPLKYDVLPETGTNMSVSGYPQTTFDTTFVVTGLQPFIVYCIELRAENQYSVRPNLFEDGFGIPVELQTLEGVPDPPVNVQTVTYGTQNIHINWSEPIFGPGIDDLINTLRGDNPEYLVRVDGELTITTNITEVNLTADDGLQPGSLHRIEVFISNQAEMSPATVVNASTWPLPPQPVLIGDFNPVNCSITVAVMLNDEHRPIEMIHLQATQNTSEEFMSIVTQPEFVNSFPDTFTFNIAELKSNTRCNIVAVGTYQTVLGFVDEPEVNSGDSITVITGVCVPEAPVITLLGDNILWSRPDDNGSPIIQYRIIAIPDRPPNIPELSMDIIPSGDIVTFNLQEQNLLEFDITYNISVVAVNNNGDSNHSNVIQYTRVGVPKAPVITLLGDNLLWSRPDDNGSPIIRYQILAIQDRAPNIPELSIDIVPSADNVTFNLQEQNLLEFDIAYNISVVAENGNGNSRDSNVVQYTRVGDRTTSEVGIIVSVVGGLVFFIIVITITTVTVVRVLIVRRRKHDNKFEHIYDTVSLSALEMQYNITMNDAYVAGHGTSATRQNIERQNSTASHCSYEAVEEDELRDDEDQTDSAHEHKRDASVCGQAGDDYEQAQRYELAGGAYERVQDYEQQQANGVYDQFKGQDYEQTSDPYDKVQDYEQQPASGAYDQVQSYERLQMSDPYDQVQSYERLQMSDPYDQVQSYERLQMSDPYDQVQSYERLQMSDPYDQVQSYERLQMSDPYDQVQSYERLQVGDQKDQVKGSEQLPARGADDPVQSYQHLQAHIVYDPLQGYEIEVQARYCGLIQFNFET